MIKEIIDAVIAVAFCMTLALGAKETYAFFKKESILLLKRGQNDLSNFNQSLTKKSYDWEK